jgi:hypothetical protein
VAPPSPLLALASTRRVRRRWLGRGAPAGVLASLAALAVTTGCEAPLESSVWQDVTSSDGRFTAKFPGAPNRQKQTRQDEDGPYEAVHYHLTRGATDYGVTYRELRDEISGPDQPASFLDRYQERMFDAAGKRKLVSAKPAVSASAGSAGFPGRHVEFEDGSTRVVMRVFPVRRRLYLVITTFPKSVSAVPTNYVDRFLDSFTVTG